METSDIGLGVVVSQDFDGEEHPYLCLSKKFFPREKAYSIIEKEALGIKWAVDSLRYYLLGRPFSLVIDHVALQWLHSKKYSTLRITYWYLARWPNSL